MRVTPVVRALVNCTHYSASGRSLTTRGSVLTKLKITPSHVCASRKFANTGHTHPRLSRTLTTLQTKSALIIPGLSQLTHSIPSTHRVTSKLATHKTQLRLNTAMRSPGSPVNGLFFGVLTAFTRFRTSLVHVHAQRNVTITHTGNGLHNGGPGLSRHRRGRLRHVRSANRCSVNSLKSIFNISQPAICQALTHRTMP